MFHHFKLLPFLAGLAAGYVVFFLIRPDASTRDRVVKWPNPENAGKTVYRDRNGMCYTFEAQIADCAKVKESLTTYNYE